MPWVSEGAFQLVKGIAARKVVRRPNTLSGYDFQLQLGMVHGRSAK